jgi:hypothetical protein
MFADADHEVIDSPEALLRHLYEEHGVEEARELDPETAPVQFWVRRHAELERAQRTARRDEPTPPAAPAGEPHPGPGSRAGPGPGARQEPPPSGPRTPPGPGRRPAGFGDPLVEAIVRTLAGRGHDEAAVRAAVRSFGAGGRTGEAAVRAAFVEPMLRSAAERLLDAPAPAAPDPDPGPGPGREEVARPEAAWAVLWADLADTRRPLGGDDPGPGGEDGDDLMAVANAVQQRRRVRMLRR